MNVWHVGRELCNEAVEVGNLYGQAFEVELVTHLTTLLRYGSTHKEKKDFDHR